MLALTERDKETEEVIPLHLSPMTPGDNKQKLTARVLLKKGLEMGIQ
jgi:hypothetical protein